MRYAPTTILFAACALLALTQATSASAEPLDVYGATENPEPFIQLTIRGGAGSLFGPQFAAGQPRYASAAAENFENQRPYSAADQLITTYGGAATLEFPVGRWTFGATGLGGIHHANRSAADPDATLAKAETFRGQTVGGGLRATYGLGTWRFTLDGLLAISKLEGEVAWTVAERGPHVAESGRARWDISYVHAGLLAGVELELGPFFVFGNAGGQYLPEQNVERTVDGTLPSALPEKGGELTVAEGVRSVEHLEDELGFAATVGVGFRF